jgi:hypothetical protein
MTARGVHPVVAAVVAGAVFALGAPPAGGLTTSPGMVGVQAQTSLGVACFGPCPADFDDSFGESSNGTDGRASSSYDRPRGSARASVDEAAGSLSAFLSGSVDLSAAAPGAAASNQGFAGAAINDTITLSAAATIVLEGSIAGTLSLMRGNDSVSSPVSLGARIRFTGPLAGEDRIDYGGLTRSYVDGETANESFAIPVELPAGTSNVNASLQAFTDFRVSSGGAESGTIDFSNSLNFTIVVPAGVTATSASGLLPGTSGRTPRLSIGDAEIAEGNAGTTPLTFTVSLSERATTEITVDYATDDGSATAATDYQATSGTLAFAPGETSKTLNVSINGDTDAEGEESLLVHLTNPAGAIVEQETATGTITNDDGAPPPPPPSGPCITVAPAGETVDFGNAGFSTPGSAIARNGSADVVVSNCGDQRAQLLVRGTEASGPSGSWALTSGDPCDSVNAYGLALGDLTLASVDAPWVQIAASETTSATPRLAMPCAGSLGSGETLSMQIVITAEAAP